MTSPSIDDLPVTTAEQVIKAIALVIAIIAAISNSVVIVAQLRTPSLRRTGLQWLFIALQVNDATLMVAVSISLSYQLHYNITPDANDTLCTAQASITILCGVTSWIVLGLIALNRWYLVVLGRRWRSSTYLAILAISLAGSSTLIVLQVQDIIPIWAGAGRLICLINWTYPGAVTRFVSILTICEVVAAAAICIYCYITLFHHVRRIKARLDSTITSSTPKLPCGSLKHGGTNGTGVDEMQVVKRLCVVTIGQALLWAMLVATVTFNAATEQETPPLVDQIQLLLVDTACMVMPWLVCWVQKNVRTAVVRLLTLQPARSIVPAAATTDSHSNGHTIHWINSHQLDATVSSQHFDIAVVPVTPTPKYVSLGRRSSTNQFAGSFMVTSHRSSALTAG